MARHVEKPTVLHASATSSAMALRLASCHPMKPDMSTTGISSGVDRGGLFVNLFGKSDIAPSPVVCRARDAQF
jgi:hypothetical protein